MLKLTKKGDKYWLFEDSQIGLFSPSKFTINLELNQIVIVYENGLKSKRYNVIDCEIYDLGELTPFNTSSGDLFMQKLEELNCPCFQKNENIYNISGGAWGDITGTLSDQTDLQNALNDKLDKVSTAGVERAYIINADGSQGTKPTSELKDVLEFSDLASFPVTGETEKIYLALDTNFTYRWSGSTYVQLSAGIDFPIDGKTYGVKDGLPLEINSERFFKYLIRANGLGFSYFGDTAFNIIGTGSNVYDSTYNASFYQVATAATAGSFAELRNPNFSRKLKSQVGNFSMLMYFNANGALNYRCYGGSSDTSGIGNINPSTYVAYHFGIGADDSDVNYQLIYGDSAGERTKIDLGWAKTGKKYFFLQLENTIPNGNTTVKIFNLSESLFYSASIPFTFYKSYRLWCGNSSDAISVNAGFGFLDLNVKF